MMMRGLKRCRQQELQGQGDKAKEDNDDKTMRMMRRQGDNDKTRR